MVDGENYKEKKRFTASNVLGVAELWKRTPRFHSQSSWNGGGRHYSWSRKVWIWRNHHRNSVFQNLWAEGREDKNSFTWKLTCQHTDFLPTCKFFGIRSCWYQNSKISVRGGRAIKASRKNKFWRRESQICMQGIPHRPPARHAREASPYSNCSLSNRGLTTGKVGEMHVGSSHFSLLRFLLFEKKSEEREWEMRRGGELRQKEEWKVIWNSIWRQKWHNDEAPSSLIHSPLPAHTKTHTSPPPSTLNRESTIPSIWLPF